MKEISIDDCFIEIRNGANIKQGVIDGGYPITRIETLSNDKFNRDRMGYAGITDLEKYAEFILEDQDLLMSHINSVQYLGRTVLYKKIDNEVIIHGMNLLKLKPNKDTIYPAYIKYLFYGRKFRSNISKITKKSVNQASFAVGDLKKILIELPEMKVQISIVDKLERVENIIELRQKQLMELDNLIKSRFVEMFGNLVINSKCWKEVNISEILNGKVSNGFFAKRDDYCENGNVSIVGVANVVNRMYSAIKGLPKTNADIKEIEKFEVKYGDLLFCRSSLVAEGIGKASIVPFNVPNNLLFECHVIRLQLDLKKCIPEYIQMLTTTDYFRNQILKHAKTSTMTTIGQDGILKSMVLLPPIEEQIKFLDFVKAIDKLKVEVQKSLDEIQVLFDSLMQKYFE